MYRAHRRLIGPREPPYYPDYFVKPIIAAAHTKNGYSTIDDSSVKKM
jgi:hypothetical protein